MGAKELEANKQYLWTLHIAKDLLDRQGGNPKDDKNHLIFQRSNFISQRNSKKILSCFF